MLHELTIEEARPGSLPALVDGFRRSGLALRHGRAGAFRGAWITEFGDLNRLCTLWEYADEESVGERNEVLHTSADWQRHARETDSLLAGVTTMLLRPQRPLGRAPDDAPLYDLRFYDLKPYTGDLYVRLLDAHMELRERFSRNFCIWRPASGEVHRIVHMWPYESVAQRAEVRAQVAAQPEWSEFTKQVFPLIVRQRSNLLSPVRGLQAGT